MAKPLPLLVGVLGIGATAAGGALLLNRKGAGNGENTPAATTSSSAGGGTGGTTGGTGNTSGPNVTNGVAGGGSSASTPSTDLLFADVAAFKAQTVASTECMKDYFDGINMNTTTEVKEIDEANKTEAGQIFKAQSGTGFTPFKSCLIVNGKKSVDNGKGNGKFTGLWTFVRGNEGFINFNVMEPGSTDGKVKFTGLFYLVQKTTGDSPKWEVKFKKEVTDNTKEVEKTAAKEHFPKVSTTFKTTAQLTNEYWDYGESPDKLDEMCNAQEACKATPEVKKYGWEAKTDAAPNGDVKPLKEWSESLTGWEKIYGIKEQWNLEEKTKEFKGTGAEAK